MLKIIHCADIHLDSPMKTHMTSEQASERNLEIIKSFIRLTEYAQENDVRVVLIAGDLFDSKRIKSQTVEEILNAIRRTPDIDYLYLRGNHDEAVHIFSDCTLPQNFKQFTKEWQTFVYENIAISGIEMTNENASSFYEEVPYIEDHINIVTLHGDVGTNCGVDKINLNLLKGKGIDYLALGHIHSYALEEFDDKSVYCYPGCLEGRGFDECGDKGFVLLMIKQEHIHSEFVPFSSRKLHRVSVDSTGLARNSQVIEKMSDSTRDISPRDMVEFTLVGSNDPTANISEDYIEKFIKGKFFFTKVKDKRTISINLEDYKNDISLKGEFIRLVLSSHDISEEDKAMIIRIGIEALAGEEIML